MRIIKPSKRPRNGHLSSQADFAEDSLAAPFLGDQVSTAASVGSKESRRKPQEPQKLEEKSAAQGVQRSVSSQGETDYKELYAKGIRLLAMREHSVKEIADKLLTKSKVDLPDSTLIYAVIDELIEEGYLSDERFTESYVRSRANRGFGPVKIRSELRSKGICDNHIQDYLDDGAVVWFDNAALEYQKKYSTAPINDYSEWSKRARFMQSRGFTMDQIQSTIPQFSFDY